MYRITITGTQPVPQIVTGEPTQLGELRQIDGLIYNPADVAVIDAATQTRVIVAPFSLSIEAQSVDWNPAKSSYLVVGTDGSKITVKTNPHLTVSIQEVDEAAAEEEAVEEAPPARGKKRAPAPVDEGDDGDDSSEDDEDFTPPPRKGAKPAAKAAPGKKRVPVQDDDDADDGDDDDETPAPRKGAPKKGAKAVAVWPDDDE
jgi:hypothetical protein